LLGTFKTHFEHFESIKQQLSQKIAFYEAYSNEVTAAQDLLETADIHEQWDILVPGVEQRENCSAAAGTTESEIHAAINPAAHGQTSDYDLAIDLGLGHIRSDTTVSRYDMSDADYFTLMKSLNREQLEFIYDTVHHLKTSEQPLYRFLSGGAGTGKSYVLHSVLHVPANQSLTYHRLDHQTLNTLRSHSGHIKLWLIDEISMVGHRMLAFIDQRLQKFTTATSKPFGGTSVVAFGDLFQLPPVMDGFIFVDLSQSASQLEQYSSLAPNLWKENFTMFELQIIMRQQESRSFAELLNRLREGNHTPDDLQILHSRIMTSDAADYPTSAQHLFKTNAKVDLHNTSIFEKSSERKCIVHSVNSVVGAVSNDMATHILCMIPSDARKTAQLPPILPLAVGCRYEISVNISVTDGLVNGAGGIVKFFELTSSNNTAAGTVWIMFDDSNVGKQTRADSRALYTQHINPHWTPIQPLSRQFQVGKSNSAQVLRKQFPLRLSAAKTIHRSQGDTLDQVVVDFTSSRTEPHSHYVGLSRVRTLQGLYILNLCANKIHVSEKVKQEMAVLRSDRKMSVSLDLPYSPLHTSFKICFLNVRSLHEHIDIIRTDHILSACHVNMYCETRVAATDNLNMYNIDTFQTVMYPHAAVSGHRPHYGLAVYSKLPVLNSCQPVTFASSCDSVECSLLQVALSANISLSLACIYRRPTSHLSHLKTAISELLSTLHTYHTSSSETEHFVLIMGDFNLIGALSQPDPP